MFCMLLYLKCNNCAHGKEVSLLIALDLHMHNSKKMSSFSNFWFSLNSHTMYLNRVYIFFDSKKYIYL